MSKAPDLKELLLRKGKTQRQCGVDQCYVNQIAAGRRMPRARAIGKMAAAIGCATEEVLAACEESHRRAVDLAGVAAPAAAAPVGEG